MEGPPPGPGGEDITWPDQVAPRGRKASSTRKIKPQTSNRYREPNMAHPPPGATPDNTKEWERETWVARMASLSNFRH